jgi:hypothetical protein
MENRYLQYISRLQLDKRVQLISFEENLTLHQTAQTSSRYFSVQKLCINEIVSQREVCIVTAM